MKTKKFDLGQALNTLANCGVLIGIVLLAYELSQNRQLATIEFNHSRIGEYRDIERVFLGEGLPDIWYTSVASPESLSATDIRILDSYLMGHLLYYRNTWRLEMAGLSEQGFSFEDTLRANVPFYFGNRFAQAWWNDTKVNLEPEFVRRVDAVLRDVEPDEQMEWILKLQEEISK